MTRILVVYYSTYGHTETMANAVREGAERVPNVEVSVKRVAELMPEDVAKGAGAKLDQAARIADPSELENYDAIIVGTPTRFGNMASQMRNFWDQTGGAWAQGKLIGKIGSAFTSTGTGGGNETTLTSTYNTFIHHGMMVVGLPYSSAELMDLSEVKGGSPYGAATIAGGDGSRMPSGTELTLARAQGEHVARTAAALKAGREAIAA